MLPMPEMVVAELPGMQISRAETARRPVRLRDETVDALDTVVAATRP
ncbi:hypothetical protein ACLQ22_30415 [Micromonospora sp. DT178]